MGNTTLKPLVSDRSFYCFKCKTKYKLKLTKSQLFVLQKAALSALAEREAEIKENYKRMNGRDMSRVEEKQFRKHFTNPLWMPCPKCLNN